MPGEKRKIDEDTWLARQSKKFKCGQILSNVYDSTLAKLRIGARKFFTTNNHPNNVNENNSINNQTPQNSPLNLISNCSCPPGLNFDKCYDCETKICCQSINKCKECGFNFCSQCSLQIDEEEYSDGDIFVCKSCYH